MDPEIRTDFLVSRTDFLTGMGSVASIHGKYFEYRFSSSGQAADSKAIRSDWRVVGQDILRALQQLKSELRNVKE